MENLEYEIQRLEIKRLREEIEKLKVEVDKKANKGHSHPIPSRFMPLK